MCLVCAVCVCVRACVLCLCVCSARCDACTLVLWVNCSGDRCCQHTTQPLSMQPHHTLSRRSQVANGCVVFCSIPAQPLQDVAIVCVGQRLAYVLCVCCVYYFAGVISDTTRRYLVTQRAAFPASCCYLTTTMLSPLYNYIFIFK